MTYQTNGGRDERRHVQNETYERPGQDPFAARPADPRDAGRARPDAHRDMPASSGETRLHRFENPFDQPRPTRGASQQAGYDQGHARQPSEHGYAQPRPDQGFDQDRVHAKAGRAQTAGPAPRGARQGVPPSNLPSGLQAVADRIAPYKAFLFLALAAVLVVAFVVAVVSSCSGQGGGQAADPAAQDAASQGDAAAADGGQAQVPDAPAERRVSFCAVGDNLANVRTLEIADMWGGSGSGDGVYDFSPLYREVAPVVSSYDVAFVSQETVMDDSGEWSYDGYPSYNTPSVIIDNLLAAGFDVFNANTNHTYDYWTGSIVNSLAAWKARPQAVVIGSYESAEDRADVRTIERNGVTLAFLSYSYGQNGYDQSDLPNDYYAVPWDPAAFQQDYARARAAADVVIVYMHGGDEYTSVPNEWQYEIAQACADAGVDLLIGSHAHVIQSYANITRTGTNQTMPCVFGLGDFVSSYTDYPETVFSGMFACDIVVDAAGAVRIENPVWHSLVEYYYFDENGIPDDYVRFVSNMTAEEAANDYLLASKLGSDALEWMRSKVREVLGGSGITIVD